MATLSLLRSKVKEITRAPVFTDDDIDSYLNRGVTLIAGGLPSRFGALQTPPLSPLFSITTLSTATDAAYVAMPATYQRSLQFVADSSGSEVTLYSSMIEFSSDYPLMGTSGDVRAVVEQGGNLYYQGIPTVSETLTLHFFRFPVEMSGDSDTPDGLPGHLAEALLVNYACAEIFQVLPEKNSHDQSLWHTQLFNRAVLALEVSTPVDNRSLFLGG
jgi:hypothetical protein